jgi:hypothetical protein
MARPIISNFHKPISASPETAYAALRSLDPAPRMQRALVALGVEDRVMASHRIQIAPRRTTGYALVWWLAGDCRAEITWMASVKSDGADGSLLSVSARAECADERGYEQLLIAWPLLGKLAELHARRTLAAVAELAAQLAEDKQGTIAPATLLAVV